MLDLCIFGENGILVKRSFPDDHLARNFGHQENALHFRYQNLFRKISARSSVYQKSEDLDFFPKSKVGRVFLIIGFQTK